MSLKVTFELADADLEHFRRVMREARTTAKERGAEEVLVAAEGLLARIKGIEIPEFIRERLERIRTLVDMVRDQEWKLPEPETARVLNSLAYFSEPDDLIPDAVPGLGFLDDAIMVELVVRELRHEIDAYQDFCAFRATRDARGGRLGHARGMAVCAPQGPAVPDAQPAQARARTSQKLGQQRPLPVLPVLKS
jgi:uncharacterized membrane protein YkvA (DUF1232 family)